LVGKVQTKPDLSVFLGKRVTVNVDRPQGTRHPCHPDILYTVNYGEIPGTLSGDGHPVDAYVLGIEKRVNYAEGVVIAIVSRSDDIEDKLVVAAHSYPYTPEEIDSAVAFQERFFQSRLLTACDIQEQANNG